MVYLKVSYKKYFEFKFGFFVIKVWCRINRERAYYVGINTHTFEETFKTIRRNLNYQRYVQSLR